MVSHEADLKQLVKIKQAKRAMVKDAIAEFGARYEDNGKFTVSVDLTKGNNRQKLIEMRRGYAGAQSERSATLSARTPTVAMTAPTGEVRHIPAQIESHAGNKGFRPVINWGRPTLTWRDGVWYRRVGCEWVAE